MEITMRSENGIGIVSISGELDSHTAPELTRFFNEQVEEELTNFVADLQGLAYSSSAGIRIFLGLARETRNRKGDLRIASVQPQVDKIFKLSKFDRIVRVFPTVEEAVNSYK